MSSGRVIGFFVLKIPVAPPTGTSATTRTPFLVVPALMRCMRSLVATALSRCSIESNR